MASANPKILVAAAVGTLLVLALLWPRSSACRTTLIGSQPGSPDPNVTTCHGYLAQQLGRLPMSEGDPDVLVARLQARAAIAGAFVLGVLLLAARALRDWEIAWRALAVALTVAVALTALALVWLDQGWFTDPHRTETSDG